MSLNVQLMDQYALTQCHIDLKALKNNYSSLVKLAKNNKFFIPTRKNAEQLQIPTQVLSVVKANAYGHGVEKIAKCLDESGCKLFGVSDVAEGICLRKSGIEKPILLFESTLPIFSEAIIEYDLMSTICTLELAESLNQYAEKKKKRVDVHVKVDTGMGRLGVWHEDAFEFIRKIYDLKYLRITGLYTHFPAADTDPKFTQEQINCLYDLVMKLDKQGWVIPYIHGANSMGLVGYKTKIFNIVRPGLMLYGHYPIQDGRDDVVLKPVMTVHSKVIMVKDIKKGQSVSYGRTFFTKKDMTVAIIPIGYHDGYFRDFSNRAAVLICGKRCKVIGRVTMDQTIVDVSDIDDIKLGDDVVIMGCQKDEEITADELARYSETISYEILCSFGNGMAKKYIS